MQQAKIAVVLSGCGVFDGAEINEVILTLLALEEQGLGYQCFAPDSEQHHVLNHLTGETMPEKRNVLVEAARIVRGNIRPLSECDAQDYSALIVPGGFGVAKNLSDLAFKGSDASLQTDFEAVCHAFRDQKKPAGYICIAPALLGKIYGTGIKMTIGDDAETISVCEAMGAVHLMSHVDEIVIDEQHKMVSTPAYMLAKSIKDAKSGIDKLVGKVAAML